jgi:cyclopropane fatty-acyl-phospholipid synthase-like methyltransferase
VAFLSREKILGIPFMYSLLQKFISKDLNKLLYRPFFRIKENDTVLDIGCGPADLLATLPESVNYFGFDLSKEYILKAQERYKNRRATFNAESVSVVNLPSSLQGNCDVVIAVGVLHHLSDMEAKQLFDLAKLALKKGGRLITFDNCYTDNQNPVARYLISKDRGEYIRHEKRYREMIADYLGSSCKVTLVNNFLRIPYNHIIIEWVKA